MSALARAGRGALAGAVGTIVLDSATYADMLARGRPASELPDQAAAQLAAKVGIDLRADTSEAKARRQALGTLLGTATGVGIGAAYGFVRPAGPLRPVPAEGAVVALVAMVAANLPMTAQGMTDPRTWGWSGWLADALPHLAYGAATAAMLRRLVISRG